MNNQNGSEINLKEVNHVVRHVIDGSVQEFDIVEERRVFQEKMITKWIQKGFKVSVSGPGRLLVEDVD